MTTHTVLIALADGVTDSCLAVMLDVLRTANELALGEAGRRRRQPPFAVATASVDGRPVRTGSGYWLSVDRDLASRRRDQIVVFPGQALSAPQKLGPMLARPDVQRLVELARASHRRGALLCAGCTATFILGDAGLLDGRVATTTWWLASQFRQRFPAARLEVEQALAVDRRAGLVTAGSAMAHADLALWLVRRFASPALARLASRYLLIDERLAQAPYMVLRRMSSGDALLERLESFVRGHLAEPIDARRLARAAGMSPRTLARRLESRSATTPAKLVQRVRAEAAAHLLETTDLGLQEVAERVGYLDVSALRRLVKREAGRGPRELRRRVALVQRARAARRT